MCGQLIEIDFFWFSPWCFSNAVDDIIINILHNYVVSPIANLIYSLLRTNLILVFPPIKGSRYLRTTLSMVGADFQEALTLIPIERLRGCVQ